MTIKNFIKCVIVIFLVTIILSAIIENFTFSKDRYEVADYQIKSGDTLWQIGVEHKAEEDDVRDWIDEVIELNGGISSLRPGQHIHIYTAK